MPVLVCGSIATDHLMHFPGNFADQLLAEHLDKVSLSFLVDELVVRRGGVAANIAFGLAALGESPVLVGAVGADFDEYRAWLTRHGVDCDSVYVSALQHTARFVCTTDEQMCQIASFYAGAMSEARNIELAPAVDRTGADLVLVSADDPAAMVRHSEECRDRGYRFAADPSQQIARMDGAELIALIDGASLLFTNDYERRLLESKTGLSDADILKRVEVRVCTLGSRGVEISGRDLETVVVPAAREYQKADPTGVGDGFRAGFLAARSWGLSWENAAQVGGLLATLVLETVGTQEYQVKRADFVERLAESYGDEAAATIAPYLAEQG
jgi:adenosine kinase